MSVRPLAVLRTIGSREYRNRANIAVAWPRPSRSWSGTTAATAGARIATPISHPALGEIEILRNATQIEGVSGRIRRPAPEAGEHSDEILLELGLESAEIEALRAAEII